MQGKTTIVCAVLMFCLAGYSSAESLKWADCVKEAQKSNPDIISAAESIKQGESSVTSSKSKLMPSVGSSISAGRSGGDESDTGDSYSVGVSARQLVFDGGKTSTDIQRSKEQLQAVQYKYDVTSANIRLKLRVAFINLLKAQKRVTICDDILKRRKQSTKLIKLRYEGGREHKGSLLTAEAKEAQAEFDLVQAKRSVDLAKAAMKELLGRSPVDDKDDIVAEGDLGVVTLPREKPDFAGLAESSPVVRELVQQSSISKLGLKSAKADFYPDVYASAGADRSASDWPPTRDQWSVGLSLSFPLFEGGSRAAELTRAKSAAKQANADERSGRLNVATSLLTKWTAAQNAVDRIKVSQKFLDASRERAKISEVQYSSGLIGFDAWIIIEDDFVSSEATLLDNQAGASTAEAEWIYVKGGTLENEPR